MELLARNTSTRARHSDMADEAPPLADEHAVYFWDSGFLGVKDVIRLSTARDCIGIDLWN